MGIIRKGDKGPKLVGEKKYPTLRSAKRLIENMKHEETGERKTAEVFTLQIEDLKNRLSGLLLTGYNIKEAAAELGIEVTEAKSMTSLLKKEWREERLGNTDDLVSIELQKIGLVTRMCFEAFKKSKGPQDIFPGDPRWMDLIVRMMEYRAKILGLHSAISVKMEHFIGNPEEQARALGIGSSVEEAARYIEEHLKN